MKNLPMPPSLNNSYINVRGVGRVASKELINYKTALRVWGFDKQDVSYYLAKQLRDQLIRIDLKFFFARKRVITKLNTVKKNDVSNRIKAIEDGLCSIFDTDDKYVFSITAEKMISPDDNEFVNAEIYVLKRPDYAIEIPCSDSVGSKGTNIGGSP
jgi:hypothetical protein